MASITCGIIASRVTACGGESRRRTSTRKWAVLLAFVTAAALFLFVLGPMGLESEPLKPMADFIEENDINANAYYYTEVDEFFSAERHMREHLKLVPGADR
jgi:hypothetical protein